MGRYKGHRQDVHVPWRLVYALSSTIVFVNTPAKQSPKGHLNVKRKVAKKKPAAAKRNTEVDEKSAQAEKVKPAAAEIDEKKTRPRKTEAKKAISMRCC